MKTVQIPKLITHPASRIDHKATGQEAKLYRGAKRISVTELSTKLGFAHPSSISNLESGLKLWTEELMERYVRGISELLENNPKPI